MNQCDYCDEGLPLVDGWHLRVDPEGIEPTAKIPCQKSYRGTVEDVDVITEYDYETEGLGGT